MLRRALASAAGVTRRSIQFHNRGKSTGGSATNPQDSCSCAVAQAALPAEPASVVHHDHHVFVRLPVPADSPPCSDNEPWWPPFVEKEPGVTKVFSAVAEVKKDTRDLGPVKVSACIEMGDDGFASHDLYMFPPGVGYRGVDLQKVKELVAYHLTNPVGEEMSKPPGGVPPPLDLEENICLFVCCHGSRDSRCGVHGIPLARQLHQEVLKLQESGDIEAGDIRVFQVSHVGGHKYAGNVIVHGPLSPYDGEWYGGLKADDAEQFIQELLMLPDGIAGGHHNPVLRKWWRGCIGLTRQQQAEVYATPAATEDDFENDSDDQDSDSDDESMLQGSELHGGIQYMDEDDMEKKIAELEADETQGSIATTQFDAQKPLSFSEDFGAGIMPTGSDEDEKVESSNLDKELERILQILPEEHRKMVLDEWHRTEKMSDEELTQATQDLNDRINKS